VAAAAKDFMNLARAGDLESLGKDRLAVADAIQAFARGGDSESALELFARSWRIWFMRGELDEGRRVAAGALAAPADVGPTVWRARTLYADGVFAFRAGDTEGSRHRNDEALRAAREIGDGQGECDALTGLARLALREGKYEEVVALARQGRERAKATGEREAEASPLHLQAAGVRLQGDYAAARVLYLESLELNESLGNAAWVAMELDCLGWVELHLGNVAEAAQRFRDRDATLDDDPYAVGWSKLTWAAVAAASGDTEGAKQRYAEAAGPLTQLTHELDPDDQAELNWLSDQLAIPVGERPRPAAQPGSI
jgi:tetratricopeptide (TPR) repeat protein